MKLESKRLFINNLPENINQSDLETKFSEYGTVTAIEIKDRKNILPKQTSRFAYIQLTIENNNLNNCIDEFSNKKWKGHLVNLQIAKESFMERLKREREEIKLNGTSELSLINNETFANGGGLKTIHKVSINKKRYHSSSSEDENGIPECKNLENSDIKSKKSLINNTLEIESSETTAGCKEQQANIRRLQSILQMKQDYRNQKSVIQNALSNIDSKPKNKIVFDDIESSEPKLKKVKSKTNVTKLNTSSTKHKLTLFEENDQEDAQYNFEIKEQFEGKKGKKLMELQSKFKNDKRFVMDTRFLDESAEESDDELQIQKDNDNDVEISFEDEKQKQFEILAEVLGKKVSRLATSTDEKKIKNPSMMLRFDPSQPEHSKYEVTESNNIRESEKSIKQHKEKVENSAQESAPKPEVSKETFYKITVDLKETLSEKKDFSLANLFEKEIINDEPIKQSDDKLPIVKRKGVIEQDANPFKYDSSSDEDDAKLKQPPLTANNTKQTDIYQKGQFARLWTEPLFFKNDDYRLQEGLDFVKCLQEEDVGDFFTIRRNLKEIVRAKVKNNQRKNRPFKRKLGGKKRLRVKRALKR